MGIKLSVGLQKKVGLPDYGSLGASCYVEFEIDRCLIDSNLDGFHQKVSGAFAACQQAVNEQLALQQSTKPSSNGNGENENSPRSNGHTNGNGNGSGNGNSNGHTNRNANGNSNGHHARQAPATGHANGNDRHTKPAGGTATQSQLRAIFAIARRQQVNLQNLIRDRFNLDRPEDLSIREASSLIDDLKQRTTEVRS